MAGIEPATDGFSESLAVIMSLQVHTITLVPENALAGVAAGSGRARAKG